MKLYPLGLQRDLKDNFDKVDYGADGIVKPHALVNRKYNGLYTKLVGEEVWMYYYDWVRPDIDMFEKEKIYAAGYSRTKLRVGQQHPLYVCFDIFVWKDGKYKKVCAERELLPYRAARTLLKEYLDPYHFKPNHATKDLFKPKQKERIL